MLAGMRAPYLVVAAVLLGCHPSASVERTMPVANLQTYKTVALRVAAVPQAQGQAYYLESAVLERLHGQCGFEAVARAGGQPADLYLDLNVTAAGRGGSGWITNANLATMDTLLVLTDGQSGELIGSARIHGQSSQMALNNNNPEQQAVDVIAKTIADMLAKSGCSGPRIAKAPPPVTTPPPNTGSAEQPAQGSGAGSATVAADTEAHRAEADKLNEDGKLKFRSADLSGAIALFEQANQLAPDARYTFNICLAYEAQQQWDQAIATCKEARSTAKPDLQAKIDHRLDLLSHHQ
jgi:tetratricopeptide (TPR) repeat protein